MTPTIKDVAALAGVAISSASYALNGSKKVSPATARRVLEAAKQLNYQKNGLASDLKRSQTNTIALIVSDLAGPFYSELIRGIQVVTSEKGYNLIACNSIGGDHSTAIKFIKEKRVDGIIVSANNIHDQTIIDAKRAGFPIVLLDRFLKEEDSLLHVEVENQSGGFIATEHLIKNGHNKIAYISGSDGSNDNVLRFTGYKRALAQYDLTYDEKWNISGHFTQEGGHKATKILLRQQNLPTAIFYGNDEMAIGGMMALKEAGLRIPQHISIIGFDDILQAQYVTPGLTTMKQPKYEAGALAVNLIFRTLKGEQVDEHYQLKTELVQRGTVKAISN